MLQDWTLAGIWELEFLEGFTTIPWEDWLTIPELFFYKQYGFCFASLRLEFCYMLVRCSTWPAPSKTLSTESLMNFPDKQYFTCGATTCCRVSCERHLGHLCLLTCTLPHAPFPFDDCVLHPFAVRNHSHVNDYTLSPVSHLSKS